MAYISVNGYDFPPPKRGAKPTVSTMVDAGRNANGTVVGPVSYTHLTLPTSDLV